MAFGNVKSEENIKSSYLLKRPSNIVENTFNCAYCMHVLHEKFIPFYSNVNLIIAKQKNNIWLSTSVLDYKKRKCNLRGAQSIFLQDLLLFLNICPCFLYR